MKLISNLKYLITEAASLDNIQKSIGAKNLVSIYYDGDEDSTSTGKGYRIIEPVCIGTHKDTGNLVLCAWETEGSSYSRGKKGNPIPGWRLFRVDKIFTFKPTMDNFTEVRPLYNPNGDRSMIQVLVNAKFNNEENIT